MPDGRVGDALVEQRQHAADRAVVLVHGQVQRQHVLAEQALAQRDGVVEVGPRAVELGDHDGPRQAGRLALRPQRGRRRVQAVRGRHDEQRGVRGAQAGPQLTHQVGVARDVEQGHRAAVVLQRRGGQEQRPAQAVLELVGVPDGAAVLHVAGPGQHAGGVQQRVDQRGLARTGRADEGDVAQRCGRPGGRRRRAAVAGRAHGDS